VISAFVAIGQIWLLGLHIGFGDRLGWGPADILRFGRRRDGNSTRERATHHQRGS